jgi:amino acid permease
VLVAAAVILLPLVLRRRVDSLRYTSAVSILLAAIFMLITMGIAVYTLFTGTAKMPRLLPDFSSLSSPFELFTAVPVIVVAFTFHFNVHPIRAELSKTSEMKSAVRISLVLCAVIYAAVGFFGFLLFGDATMPDVLANFDRSSGAGVPQALNDAARLSYALHLVLVFPLLHYSLRVNVDELLFPGRRPLATDTRRFVALTAVLMAVLYALAIAIPSIWTLFQYTGSTFAVCISLIFPGAEFSLASAWCIFWLTGQHQFRPREKDLGNVAVFGQCYRPLLYVSVGIEERSAPFGRGSHPRYALRIYMHEAGSC